MDTAYGGESPGAAASPPPQPGMVSGSSAMHDSTEWLPWAFIARRNRLLGRNRPILRSSPPSAGPAFALRRSSLASSSLPAARTAVALSISDRGAGARSVGPIAASVVAGSKERRDLDIGLAVFIAWRTLVRRRFHDDSASPSQVLGWTPRRMSEEELCSWRQDWGRRSIHPLGSSAESIERSAERGSKGPR